MNYIFILFFQISFGYIIGKNISFFCHYLNTYSINNNLTISTFNENKYHNNLFNITLYLSFSSLILLFNYIPILCSILISIHKYDYKKHYNYS